ncbi:hypothetical protein Aduo_006526 [Ancylostoma duodenale]
MIAHVLCLDIFSLLHPIPLRLITVYRPPSSPKHEDDKLIETIFDLCSASSQVVLLGDFNVNLMSSARATNDSATRRFENLFESCNLVQNVSAATRQGALLDLVLSSEPITSNLKLYPPFGNSDHNIVLFTVNISCQEPLYLPLPDFRQANYSELIKYLADVDWFNVFSGYSSASEIYY